MHASSLSEKPRLKRVAECLWRNTETQIFYALAKRGGKQFKKSLRTNDRKLAERLVTDFRRQIGGLNVRMSAGKVTFSELAQGWLAVATTRLKKNSATRLEGSVKNLTAFFGVYPVRAITTASFESLLTIAWIHQFAHLLHVGIPDAAGKFNRQTTHEFGETIAQWATWKTVNANPSLHDTFLTLTENLCDACYCPDAIRECSNFEMCSYLWCVRNNARRLRPTLL